MSTKTSHRTLGAPLRLLSSVAFASVALSLAACGGAPPTEPETPGPVEQAEAPVEAEPVEAEPEPAPEAAPAPRSAKAAVAALGKSGVTGEITFTEVEGGIEVSGTLSGLKPGSSHGFHIHEKGDCSSPDGKSAGGHFNPHSKDHGGPDAEHSHVGDLGNVVADDKGVATVKVTKAGAVFDGDSGIVGRGVIVHGGKDDLKSQPSGAAGPRVGCGVIEGS